ncbi:toxin [Cupriavidus sp. USMAHM13]|uniref:CYTH domain-containing protein n=1 Tax=Cupriavidus sp. USMAHM13 TaxID=1389192 RepID=UPI0008A66A90|nr:CYTH domain-containing protein [Cupriavidus sp. USMAHM13]AOZ00918.1 toxin [Cupriavidus sp. USMAHM13]
MAQEIELKLAVPDGALDALAAWLDAHGEARGRWLLRNVYLDTPARELAGARAALRLRSQGERWLQTLKTAGSSAGGLATRHEWETDVAGEALEPARLPAEAQSLLAPLAQRLAPVFRTDFERRAWLVRQDGAEIEAALDVGTVSAPGTKEVERIQELELEFLAGDATQAAQALRALAARLQAVAALVPSDLSKAARGYRLAGTRQDEAP